MTLPSKFSAAKAQLLPNRIGKWGQLQEWKEDRDNPKKQTPSRLPYVRSLSG